MFRLLVDAHSFRYCLVFKALAIYGEAQAPPVLYEPSLNLENFTEKIQTEDLDICDECLGKKKHLLRKQFRKSKRKSRNASS